MTRPRTKYVGRDHGEHLAATTPAGPFYTDEPLFRKELERFFVGGRYSEQELRVYDFDEYVRRRLEEA
ncbi:MAG TPA: hypothetical protein VEM77_02725 [Thermoplasmata archaeon]|nr:hypothetical protein [Thermoplasmata archaeon]